MCLFTKGFIIVVAFALLSLEYQLYVPNISVMLSILLHVFIILCMFC